METLLRKNLVKCLVAVCTLALLLSATGCFSGRQGKAGTVKIQGAGSSFINPLMQKWVSEYGLLNTGVRIDYQSIGSGGGIKQLREQTIQYAASDVPMKDEDLKSAPGEILHIPVILGAVAVTYNLKEISTPLRFPPDVITDIFFGRIKRWNDPRIAADNPGLPLPDAEIIVVHRSDGSGTSAVFTNYLSKVSADWKNQIGEGTAPKFPAGLGGKGNEGVTGLVKQTPNAIGYVELAYAVKNKLPVGELRNRAGNYIAPSFQSVTNAAADSIAETPEDLRVSITDPPGEKSYPISSYVYILLYREQTDETAGRVLTDFLTWGINDGSKYAQALYYAPLPEEMVKRSTAKIALLKFGGQPIMKEKSDAR